MKHLYPLLTVLALSCVHTPKEHYFKISAKHVFTGQEDAGMYAEILRKKPDLGCEFKFYVGKEKGKVSYFREEERCIKNNLRFFGIYESIDWDQDGKINFECRRSSNDYKTEQEVLNLDRICKTHY
jgi:hypothetical protein